MKFVAIDNGCNILITNEDNANAIILDLNKCCKFNGTLEQATEYCKKLST